MRRLTIITTILLSSGCAHTTVAESLAAARAGLGLAEQAAAQAAAQYCALVPEDECSAMQSATQQVIKSLNDSEAVLEAADPIAVDIDKAVEARKAAK